MDTLRGRILTHKDAVKGTSKRELATQEELLDVLTTVFGREIDDLTPADRSALWARVSLAHETWRAGREG
ncbi:hypothetical protein J7F03_06090 [Streptomyces sp. ISL-43]|uniref:hypothetical protein n=1 Tax=Streptomyces sp. ISL-43 TaxID=2819183 RepID=UPI001BE7FE68|nr:hypothetical protein [Streptomyces sp. ISL-43]MBT2446655.1 hypothetical protein [Streptomyces sp. ISL-43]